MGAIWDQDLIESGGAGAAPWEQDLLPPGAAKPAAQQYVGQNLPQRVGRAAALVGQALGAVPADVLGTPGNLERLGVHYVENPIRQALGFPQVSQYVLPTSQDLAKYTDQLGLTGYPAFQPSNAVERVGTDIVRGGVGAAALSALGLGGVPGTMGMVGAGSAGAAGLSHELGAPPWASGLVGLGTGFVGAGIANSLENSAAQRGAAATADAASAAQRDIKKAALYAPGDLADATKARIAEAKNTMERAQGQSAMDLQRNEAMANGIIANTRAQITGGLPPMSTMEAGKNIQEAGRNWFDALPDRMKQIWDPVDQTIPGNTTVIPGNYTQYVNSINRTASNQVWQDSLDAMQAKLPKHLQGLLERVQEKEGAIPTMTWDDARAFRDAFGDALTNKGLVKGDATQKQLSGLYRSVTQDMRDAADGLPPVTIGAGGVGTQVSPAVLFDQANAEATRLHGFVQGPLRRIITSPDAWGENVPAEKVPGALLNVGTSGATDLGKLAQEIGPGFTNPLLAAHLSPGVGGGKDLPTWDKMSDAAKAALVPDQAARDELNFAHRVLAESQDKHKVTLDTAQTQFNLAQESARDQEDQARRALTIQKGEAQFAKEDAKNALARLSESSQSWLYKHPWERLFLGEAIGQATEPLLHTGNPLISAGMGGVAAYAMPWAIKNTLGTLGAARAWPYIGAGAFGASQGNSLTTSESPTAYSPVPAGP